MKKSFLLLVVLIMMLALLVGPPAAAQGPVATVDISPREITWKPQVNDYDNIVLTVSGPRDFYWQQTFAAGSTPTFSQTPSDGIYTYELVVTPTLDPAAAEALTSVTEENRDAVIAQLRQAGKLPPPLIQSGSFSIAGGQMVDSNADEGGIPEDQVIPDDLIVQGSACVGFDCVNNENFGFDTIRLKENNLRIKFEDTSVGSFPTTDWQLTANDTASGGANRFSIEDVTGSLIPFTIEGSTPTNSLYLDSSGKIGLRTATPLLDLHIFTSDTPAIRLDQNSSGGFSPQVWDIAGNEANFFVRDLTSGSRLPFRIRPGAPTSSIDIAASGNVGVGTSTPTAKLHVAGNVLVEGNVTEFSAAEAKENFTPIDSADVLRLLADLPLTTWNYKNDAPTVRHMGPVAQDFYAAFGLGQDERHIAPLDANGVALAGIQALVQKNQEQEDQITQLQQQNRKLEVRLAALEKLVESLTQK
jgi:hypothetical protein